MKREIFLRDLMAFNGNVKPRKPQRNTEQKAKENDLINETDINLIR